GDCVRLCHQYFRLLLFLVLDSDAAPDTGRYPLSLHDALPISFSTTSAWMLRRRSPLMVAVKRMCPRRPQARPSSWATPTSSAAPDRKSTRLNSSHDQISYAVFCLKKKKVTGESLDSAGHHREL